MVYPCAKRWVAVSLAPRYTEGEAAKSFGKRKGGTQMDIGAQIAKLRKKRNMTQGSLAEQLGITDKAVSKWENAQSAPDISLLPLLAEIFRCTIDDLFFAP